MEITRARTPTEPGDGTGSGEWPIDGANALVDERPADEFGSVDLGGNDTRGSDGGDDTVFDPERHLGRDRINADGTYRKRKRKGSIGGGSSPRKSSSRAEITSSIDTISNVLMIFHMGLATMLKTPELATTEEENRILGTSVVNVLEAYDLKPDPKIATVVGLIMACGQVYGPKVYFIRERIKAERAENRTQQNQFMS